MQESLEYQTATSDVLKVISRSGAELEAVLDTLVKTAARLCDAQMAFIHRLDDGVYRPAAVLGFSSEFTAYLEAHPLAPGRGSIAGRVALEGRAIHIPDVAADPEYKLSQSIVMAKQRTALGVPLLREDEPIGVIVLARQRVQSFTEKEIGLITTFADQAVIAMENARLITEAREALEQQTATAEVLQVINSSPGDLMPVFDAMLDRAMRLCGAAFGELAIIEGGQPRTVTTRGVPAAFAKFRSRYRASPLPGSITARVFAGEPVIHTIDAADSDLYREGEPHRRAMVDLGGARTSLAVTLMKDRDVLGAIHVYRQEVRPFTEKQIALLQNFAAQAVIAMENARLLNEIRQRQAELRVTFDNMVDGVAMFDGELRLAAWNRNFQELFDLADDFLAERRGFDEHVRYLTERGEFGETTPRPKSVA